MIKNILASALVCSSLVTSTSSFAQESTDPEALFTEAMQYREDGELFRAIEIFETILSNQPGLNRARLELAVSYHQTRRYEEAKQQLTKVLNDPKTPENVKLSITAYLAQLSGDAKAAAQRSKSSIYISVGTLNDSNVNLGPSADNREITDTLSVTGGEESGSGGQFMFSYSHRSRASKPLAMFDKATDFEWLSQATAYNKAYANGDSEFNLGVVSLNTGPALIVEKSWRAAFNFKADKIYFGNDPYAFNLSINPVFTYNIMDDLEITLENLTTVREHEERADEGLDGTMKRWGIDLAKFFAKQSIGIQGGFKYHDNGADDSTQHYTGAEIYLGGQMPAWTDARAYLTLSGRDYNYKSIDSVSDGSGGSISFGERRDETELMAVLGVSHDFRSGALKSWTLNAQYTYTDNDSNLDAFDYDRDMIEVNMRRYFF